MIILGIDPGTATTGYGVITANGKRQTANGNGNDITAGGAQGLCSKKE